MIRFSAALVAVAIGVLIGGIATSELLLVYIAIVVSAVALVALGIGVLLGREELFGEGRGLVPAGAGASPGPPAGAGESHRRVPSSTQPAPSSSPLAETAGDYGTSAPAATDADLFAASSSVAKGRAAKGRSGGTGAGPVPPWETAAAPDSWSSSVPDWMPAKQAGRTTSAADGADSAPLSARQDPPSAATPRGPVNSSPVNGDPVSNRGVSDAGTRTEAAAPWPWSVPSSSASSSVPSDVPAAKQGNGSGAAPPSWFDRLGGPPALKDPALQEAGTSTDAVPGDTASGDDDWPARYAWLHEEAEESGAADRASGEPDSAPRTAADTAPEDSVPAKPSLPGRSGEDTAASPAPAEAPAPAVTGRSGDAGTRRRDTAGTGTPDTGTADTVTDGPENTALEPDADVSVLAGSGDPGEPSLDSDSDPGARDTGEAGKPEAAGEARSEPAQTAPGTGQVAVVRGVPRYHEPDCVLIRFMPEDDLQKVTIPQAREQGCTPCAACQPV